MLPHTGVQAASIVTLLSFVGTMPPTTCRVASKEASDVSIKEALEVTKPTIPIYANKQCFIDNSTEVTWKDIKDTFM